MKTVDDIFRENYSSVTGADSDLVYSRQNIDKLKQELSQHIKEIIGPRAEEYAVDGERINRLETCWDKNALRQEQLGRARERGYDV